jgi:hypothetical protein
MKTFIALLLASNFLFLPACERKAIVCSEGSVTYLSESDIESLAKLSSTGSPEQVYGPATVEIKGKKTKVDMLVQGPICNTKLAGKVYVACDIQIPKWDKEHPPVFFKECDFRVEPGSVVYVAPHNDAVFKKGCACHTGEMYVE